MVDIKYPLPDNELERLAALQALAIPISENNPLLDAVAYVAADVFGCPIGLVSLIGADTMWLKARCGIDISSAPRDHTICTHALVAKDLLVIPDTHQDSRFASNPNVVGPPFTRFYAGYPITPDGKHAFGVLCVQDSVPREPTRTQLRQLRRLGGIVEGLVRAFRSDEGNRSEDLQTRNELLDVKAQHRFMLQIETLTGIGAFSANWATGETHWSNQVFRLHDLPVGESPDLSTALQHFPIDERERIVSQIEKDLTTTGSCLVEADFVTALKRKRRVRLMAELNSSAETSGDPVIYGVMQDITDQYQNEQALWQAAHVDALSGLANRSWFNKQLPESLAQALEAHKTVALFMVDLDGFKLVNDSLGHQAGDKVIQIMASRINGVAGADAFCARLAGDEFAVIRIIDTAGLRGTDEIRLLGDRLVNALKEPVELDGERHYLGASVGIARAPHDAERPEGLLRCADMALYKAKRSGRGMALFYSDELKLVFGVRRAAIDIVRESHFNRKIEAHYQPIVDMKSGDQLGAEALVRIRTDQGTLLGPEDFWAAFEDPESARSIDSRVSEQVLSDMAAWQAEHLDPGVISINVSDYWFQTENFAEFTFKSLALAGLSPKSVRLEVSEYVLQHEDAQAINRELKALSDAGMSIALDDFGAGFASLTQLRDYPINAIKIDRSFIRDLTTNAQHMVIVKALVDLAGSLGIEVIATGVQTRVEAGFLLDIGCRQGQGTLFGDAKPGDELVAPLRAAKPKPAATRRAS